MKIRFRSWSPALILGSLLLAGGYLLPQVAMAENLRSDSFVISFGNFNIASGKESSSNYNLTDTVGQTGAGPYGEYGVSGYFVGGGFQYIYQIQTFSFRISKLNIDLGELTTGNHSTDSNVLTISTRGADGYTVYAYETHPLQRTSGSPNIADTTCDSGTCDQTAAGLWTNTSIGGFGFNANGADAPADFLTTDHFRQFADNSSGEAMQAVMSSDSIANNSSVTITYKAGLTGSEAAGNYQTSIVYVAVPGY